MFQKIKNGYNTAVNFVKKQADKVMQFVGLASAGVAASAAPSHAAGDIDDLFTAFNITGLQTNIKTILLAGVVIMTLFVGYRFLKKAGSRI